MMELVSRFQSFYRSLPDKKRYIEFISAILTVPVLATVIISNLNNIHNKPSHPSPTPQQVAVVPVVTERIILIPTAVPKSPTPTPDTQCKPEIGPIDIANPAENAQLQSDPVCIDIARGAGNYCGISWSYRIDNGDWSPYTTKDICLYGLSAGQKKVELRVKSMVSEEENILTRNFTVIRPTPTPSPEPTPTASL